MRRRYAWVLGAVLLVIPAQTGAREVIRINPTVAPPPAAQAPAVSPRPSGGSTWTPGWIAFRVGAFVFCSTVFRSIRNRKGDVDAE